MILIDTHIWVWWVLDLPRLSPAHRRILEAGEGIGLAVSVISCWEIAKLVEIGKLAIPLSVGSWIDVALTYPGVRLVDLTPRIAVRSTQLPGAFHRDPADQIIVATAQEYDWELITVDEKIRNYPHVRTVAPSWRRGRLCHALRSPSCALKSRGCRKPDSASGAISTSRPRSSLAPRSRCSIGRTS